jgi:hypothetical protein
MMKRFIFFLLILSLLLTGCFRLIEPKKAEIVEIQTIKIDKHGTDAKMTQFELQAELMNYADSFAQLFAGSCNRVEMLNKDPEIRLLCKEAKVYSISSVFSIAAGPTPEASLLDMLVVVTLNRMLWERHTQSQMYGKRVEGVHNTLINLEKQIWDISSRVLGPNAQKEIKILIDAWWESHPDVHGVHFVRFSDFSGIKRGEDMTPGESEGGIISKVSRVTQQVDASLLMAERAMYLISRLQLLASLQVDLAYMKILHEPETSGLLNNLNDLVAFSQTLPAVIAKERTAALEQLSRGISKERDAAIQQAMENLTAERKATIEQLANVIATERRNTLDQATKAINEERSDLIRQLIESQDHAFWLGIAFLIFVFFGTVSAALIYRYFRYRLIDSKISLKQSS